MPNRRKHKRGGKKSFKPSRKWTNAVKRVVNKESETKLVAFESTNNSTISSTTIVSISNLNRMAPGSASNEMIGQHARGFGLRLVVTLANTTTPDAWVRVCVISAKEDEFDATTDLYLIDNSNIPKALQANDLNTIVNRLNKNEYNVLLDKTIKVAGTGATEGGETRILRKFLKFNHHLIAPGVVAAASDFDNHNLRLLLMPVDTRFNTEVTIEFTFGSTYYYKDI